MGVGQAGGIWYVLGGRSLLSGFLRAANPGDPGIAVRSGGRCSCHPGEKGGGRWLPPPPRCVGWEAGGEGDCREGWLKG